MRCKHRTALTALVAVLAISAIGAASASAALPEFSPNPTEAKPLKLTSTFKEGARFQGTKGDTITCEGGSATTEFTSAKGGTTKLTLTKCWLGGVGKEHYLKCSTGEAKTGEIVFKALPVSLVYLAKAAHEVGFLVNYYKPKREGEKLHEFLAGTKCEGEIVTNPMRGDTIGKLEGYFSGVETSEFGLNYKQAPGTPTKFETELGEQTSTLLEWSNFNNDEYEELALTGTKTSLVLSTGHVKLDA
jgi:hypothetical protein